MAAGSIHPRAVFRMLKQGYRNYVGVGTIGVTAPGNTAVAAPTVVTGTMVPVTYGYITVEIITSPGGVQKAVQTVPVADAGTWTATFTGLIAGTYQARITTIPPASHTAVLSTTFTKS